MYGLVYVRPDTGEEFGLIRKICGAVPEFSPDGTPFAIDECGNFFILLASGEIAFWDHETNQVTILAADWDQFAANCTKPRPAELDPERVRSAWIDPDLARSLGRDVPEDGWIKRPQEEPNDGS